MSLSLPMSNLITSMEHENPFDMFPNTTLRSSKSNTHPLLKEFLLDVVGSFDTFEYLDSYETYNLRGEYRIWEAIDLMSCFQPTPTDNETDAIQVVALDDFFFMSPISEEDASRQYFEDCIAWVERYFAGQVLSSIVFTKDQASYCFVLANFVCNPLKEHSVFLVLKPLFQSESFESTTLLPS